MLLTSGTSSAITRGTLSKHSPQLSTKTKAISSTDSSSTYDCLEHFWEVTEIVLHGETGKSFETVLNESIT